MGFFELSLTLILALAWLYLAFLHGGFWRLEPKMRNEPGGISSRSAVCVVVPARNEAALLGRTLPALLSQDYPARIEVLIVDDHSTDGTAGLARKLAEADRDEVSCRVIAAPDLPAGWTGKLWALEQGVRQAGGGGDAPPDYFLFTDADILHSAGSVSSLVLKAEQESRALVSLMAKLHCESSWERILIPAFVFFFQKLYPFGWVNDPSARTAGAAGGCILVRRDALEKIGGLASVRSELIDDCALAKRVKHSGRKIWLGMSDALKSVRVYPDLGSIWNMVARTAFTQLGYSWAALAGVVIGMFWLYLWAPLIFAAGLAGGGPGRILFGGGIWALGAFLYRPAARLYSLPRGYIFTLPLAAFLYIGMTCHSAWRHLHGRGGLWKGRSYG